MQQIAFGFVRQAQHPNPYNNRKPSSSQNTRTITTATAVHAHTTLATVDDIISYAEKGGVTLSISTLGPGYRAVARASHNETLVIGYCEGFIRPGNNILHMDKMEVFKKSLARCRGENRENFEGGGTVFGVGLLLGCVCLAHGKDKGCSLAEFLAIDDGEKQHKRLVRHYKRLGLNVIRYVGDDLKSIPDRLVWGGCGTLMNENIDTLLEKWAPVFLEKE